MHILRVSPSVCIIMPIALSVWALVALHGAFEPIITRRLRSYFSYIRHIFWGLSWQAQAWPAIKCQAVNAAARYHLIVHRAPLTSGLWIAKSSSMDCGSGSVSPCSSSTLTKFILFDQAGVLHRASSVASGHDSVVSAPSPSMRRHTRRLTYPLLVSPIDDPQSAVASYVAAKNALAPASQIPPMDDLTASSPTLESVSTRTIEPSLHSGRGRSVICCPAYPPLSSH